MTGNQKQQRRFLVHHPWDQNFLLVMLACIWTAILSGFGTEVASKVAAGTLHYPLIVYPHAAAFIGWLVLFTIQIVLIRQKNVRLHRFLGVFGACLAATMVVLGCLTAVITEEYKFGTSASDPAYIATLFGDMAIFGVLVAAAIWSRANPSAHKRLMLVATLALTDAGFGRWLSHQVMPHFGGYYWTNPAAPHALLLFIGFQMFWPDLLILTVGAYDIVTRRRLHPAYLLAITWCFGVQLLGAWLYFQPGWLAFAKKLIGH
jgi:hypothetical protein